MFFFNTKQHLLFWIAAKNWIVAVTSGFTESTRRLFFFNIMSIKLYLCRSQWPRGLRRRSAAARLLRLWVPIPPGAWIFVCCECCVLSGRGLCDELITRPEESYRLWCVVVCDLETSWKRRPWPTWGCYAKNKQIIFIQIIYMTNAFVRFQQWCKWDRHSSGMLCSVD